MWRSLGEEPNTGLGLALLPRALRPWPGLHRPLLDTRGTVKLPFIIISRAQWATTHDGRPLSHSGFEGRDLNTSRLIEVAMEISVKELMLTNIAHTLHKVVKVSQQI